MAIIHDGKSIPTVDPKDFDSEVWYGFTYNLRDAEIIQTSTWLINDTVVNDGDTVDGLKFVSSALLVNASEALVDEGTQPRYILTNRISTNLTPSDDRSMYINMRNL